MNLNDGQITQEEEKEHNFIIKYMNEEQRKEYGEILLSLIQKYELRNFSVVEEKAYTESRIIFNTHTIAHSDDNLEKEEIEKKFVELFQR